MRRRKKTPTRTSLIQAYGLFWRADEINWSPGKGHRYDWRLYGRRGANSNKLQIADFRSQKGIYILYGNLGPHYVGLTRKKGLGRRLKDHLNDKHEGQWDRFSWFGFCTVLKKKNNLGIHLLRNMPLSKSTSPESMIADLEAMLIQSMAVKNINRMNFIAAKEWKQIRKNRMGKIWKSALETFYVRRAQRSDHASTTWTEGARSSCTSFINFLIRHCSTPRRWLMVDEIRD